MKGVQMYSKEDRERILADLPKRSRYPEATRREALSLLRKGLGPAAASRRLDVSSDSVVASWSRKTAGDASMAPGKGVRLDRPPCIFVLDLNKTDYGVRESINQSCDSSIFLS